MKRDILGNRDLWTGIMFMATGLTAVFVSRSYEFGTALRMGPGFFPTILGGVLIVIGLFVLVAGLRKGERIKGGWSLRALIALPASLVLFGVVLERWGFVPGLLILIFGAASAGREFKLKEVALLAAVLLFLSLGLFIWGLGLPYPLFKGL